jgi:hypothetical protein
VYGRHVDELLEGSVEAVGAFASGELTLAPYGRTLLKLCCSPSRVYI